MERPPRFFHDIRVSGRPAGRNRSERIVCEFSKNHSGLLGGRSLRRGDSTAERSRNSREMPAGHSRQYAPTLRATRLPSCPAGVAAGCWSRVRSIGFVRRLSRDFLSARDSGSPTRLQRPGPSGERPNHELASTRRAALRRCVSKRPAVRQSRLLDDGRYVAPVVFCHRAQDGLKRSEPTRQAGPVDPVRRRFSAWLTGWW